MKTSLITSYLLEELEEFPDDDSLSLDVRSGPLWYLWAEQAGFTESTAGACFFISSPIGDSGEKCYVEVSTLGAGPATAPHLDINYRYTCNNTYIPIGRAILPSYSSATFKLLAEICTDMAKNLARLLKITGTMNSMFMSHANEWARKS